MKSTYLYHTNKIEGSTFTKNQINQYLTEGTILGEHSLEDILETINSARVYEFVLDTLGEPLSRRLIWEFHQLLKQDTLDQKRGFAGCWKKIPNTIQGSEIGVAQPHEVDEKIHNLLEEWDKSAKQFEDIVRFHANFEQIHPFQDGNGRVGRFIVLKQCLENNLAIHFIHSDNSEQYYSALTQAQLSKDFQTLMLVFSKINKERFKI